MDTQARAPYREAHHVPSRDIVHQGQPARTASAANERAPSAEFRSAPVLKQPSFAEWAFLQAGLLDPDTPRAAAAADEQFSLTTAVALEPPALAADAKHEDPEAFHLLLQVATSDATCGASGSSCGTTADAAHPQCQQAAAASIRVAHKRPLGAQLSEQRASAAKRARADQRGSQSPVLDAAPLRAPHAPPCCNLERTSAPATSVDASLRRSSSRKSLQVAATAPSRTPSHMHDLEEEECVAHVMPRSAVRKDNQHVVGGRAEWRSLAAQCVKALLWHASGPEEPPAAAWGLARRLLEVLPVGNTLEAQLVQQVSTQARAPARSQQHAPEHSEVHKVAHTQIPQNVQEDMLCLSGQLQTQKVGRVGVPEAVAAAAAAAAAATTPSSGRRRVRV